MVFVWQDAAFTIGQLIFMISLLPTVMDRKSQVPRQTSVTTTAIMLGFAVTYVSLNLYFAAALSCLLAIMWGVVAWKRPVKK
ncbi:MAG: hypothetical protein HYS81_04370 [Candidatus Aenigmatarchaeota archaeon]|nr:MAG: hypothetical protein HYS81_04370 [Candidatus Aenigmarchaeota archaeon]